MSNSNKWLEAIHDERARQVNVEGWTATHDDEHTDGSIADAAACYAASVEAFFNDSKILGFVPRALWPWAPEWNKKAKHSRQKQLIIAGALILAELERLEREGE